MLSLYLKPSMTKSPARPMMPYYMYKLTKDSLLCGDTRNSVPFVNATRVNPVTGLCPDGYAGCLSPEAPGYEMSL